jgi:hypothetical protein
MRERLLWVLWAWEMFMRWCWWVLDVEEGQHAECNARRGHFQFGRSSDLW